MVPIFNISSSGGSATAWLTKLLNQHPRVVCWHALRENPFGGGLIEPARMVEGLYTLHRFTKHIRTVGVAHAFYNAAGYAEFKAAGGGYAAVLRHPVNRIHSVFIHHYRDLCGHAVREGDIYGTLRDDGTLDRFLQDFDDRVSDTLICDLHNLVTLPADAIMLFERMTADAAYCREKLEILLDEDLADFEPVIAASLGDRHNRHVEKTQSAEEIFEQWPRAYRDRFQEHATRIGVLGVRDAYRQFGYDVAPMLVG